MDKLTEIQNKINQQKKKMVGKGKQSDHDEELVRLTTINTYQNVLAIIEKAKKSEQTEDPVRQQETEMNSLAYLEQLGYTCIPPVENTFSLPHEDEDTAARHYLLHEHTSPLNEIMHQASIQAETTYHKDIENAFKAGAKKQKIKDNDKMRTIINNAFIQGGKKRERELLGRTIEGVFEYNKLVFHYSDLALAVPHLHTGDKVNVMIFEKDKENKEE